MSSDTSEGQPGGLPGPFLGVAYGVCLLGSLFLAMGVLLMNAMACDSGGDKCATAVVTASLVWAFITFVLPVAALVWGLLSSRYTRAGRRNRVIVLVLLIVLPFLGITANLLILVQPAFHE